MYATMPSPSSSSTPCARELELDINSEHVFKLNVCNDAVTIIVLDSSARELELDIYSGGMSRSPLLPSHADVH